MGIPAITLIAYPPTPLDCMVSLHAAFIPCGGQGLLTAYRCSGCLGANLVFPELVGFRCYPLNPITGCALTGRGALATSQRWVLASIPNFPNSNHHAIERPAFRRVLFHFQWTGCQVIDS